MHRLPGFSAMIDNTVHSNSSICSFNKLCTAAMRSKNLFILFVFGLWRIVYVSSSFKDTMPEALHLQFEFKAKCEFFFCNCFKNIRNIVDNDCRPSNRIAELLRITFFRLFKFHC